MQNIRETKVATGFSGIFWHCVAVVLLLVVIATFFYLRHRLIERLEHRLEVLDQVFEDVPEKLRKNRNLRRWHDSSLIFAAVKDFQTGNDGDWPKRWDNTLLDSQSNSLANEYEITIQDAVYASLPASRFADLPNEDYFHIWPGRICAGNQQANYWENTAELTYSTIVSEGSDSDFAIVYWTETLPSAGSYIKCFDSPNGFDEPDFIFKIN